MIVSIYNYKWFESLKVTFFDIEVNTASNELVEQGIYILRRWQLIFLILRLRNELQQSSSFVCLLLICVSLILWKHFVFGRSENLLYRNRTEGPLQLMKACFSRKHAHWQVSSSVMLILVKIDTFLYIFLTTHSKTHYY